MDSAEIRARFLRFFESRNHVAVPSASLLLDDPTLLFVNAGMVPFKPYFLGEAPAPFPRATSVQKCVRTLDIDQVGRTTRHASFFQMAGNFAFGDYFKDVAIPYAWELLTTGVDDGGFGFDPGRMWATVYDDDDEAADIWHNVVGMPLERIQRRGQADNYWSMGVPGPCGPCSEIYFDRGAEFGRDGGPVVDEDRFLEVWNLVFMQSYRGEGPAKEGYPILGELPSRNIDTGMGLERMAALLQGVGSIYEIDTTRVVLDKASQLTGAKYGTQDRSDVYLRVIADHSRTCTFLISDGVVPGNEGRGHVLRRLMRRVIRNMRLLGAHEPAMAQLVAANVEAMSPQYAELASQESRITSVVVSEEASFLETLRTGTQVFDLAVAETRVEGTGMLSGSQAFQLHDTHGFPIELTLEMAAEQGLEVDEDGFRHLMAEQKERAQADSRARKSGLVPLTAYRDTLSRSGSTIFTGYAEIASDATITGILRDGEAVQAASAGDEVKVVLNRTPFYAEGGGQLGDHGVIVSDDGGVMDVFDVQSPIPGLVVHTGKVRDGQLVLDGAVNARVDVERRKAISRAHTATHMIHRAFRELIGETATQMGSENAPGRLRFDFPSPKPVPRTVLADAEALVNDVLREDLLVTARTMPQPDAVAMGAMALFGEKYGETVRVVSVGDWAHELCGGTHAGRSGQLGIVTFLSESSIGAGVRRVEALVGSDAYTFLAREHHLVSQLSQMAKVPPDQLPDRVESLIARLKEAEKELERVRKSQLLARFEDIVGTGADVGEFRIWTFRAPDDLSGDDLRQLATRAQSHARPELAVGFVGGSVSGNRVSMVAAVNPHGRERGLSARDLLSVALVQVDGRGGGKEALAQGSGTRPEKLDDAFSAVLEHVGHLSGG
ncbi:MAG: alanine--tRNA ligase [Candidatus Nanopelagicales bacterium]|nr:alanine--tRNA ligase [Candidatus Nanopelagicales bacterium]